MELKHDWKAFNAVLFPQDKLNIGGHEEGAPATSYHPVAGPQKLVILEENQKITDGVTSSGAHFVDTGVDSSDMSKQRLDGIASKYGVDQTVVLNRKDLDQCITEAIDLGHNYYQQLEFIREKALHLLAPGTGKNKSAFMVSRRHFVLDLFAGQMRRVLPRSFNLLIFIDGTDGGVFQFKSLLISFNQGKVDQFFEPDFSSLHEDRLEQWSKYKDNIGEYLENRYILPCYGLFLNEKQWDRSLQASTREQNPWKLFTKFCDEGTAAVYPQNFLVKSLLASQRLMVYFGRT